MSKVIKILKKELSSNDAVDNRIFQHCNQHIAIEAAHSYKILRAIANCRTPREIQTFWDRRKEMHDRYKGMLYV